MSQDPSREYTEEIPLEDIDGQTYLKLAIQAVANLRWSTVGISSNSIVCHTEGGNNSFGESVTITIESEKVVFYSRSANEHYWPEGQNERNAQQFRQAVKEVAEQNEKAERNMHPMNREKLGALIPSKTYIVTPVLIYLNVAVYLCMIIAGVSPISPDAQTLAIWGGNFRPLTANGEWWRLISYMFLHGGLWHLLMNIYALLFIGMFLEPSFGRFRLIAAYFLTGICAGLLSVSMHSYSVGVGASGAIFGLYGVFLAMLTTRHIEKVMRNTLLRSILFFVVLNLMNGLKDNIDNAAHIGGLLSGVIIGYIYYPGLAMKQKIKKQLGITAIMTAAVVLLSFIVLPSLTDDIAIYGQKMKKFAEFETLALQTYKTDSTTPKKDLLYEIADRGIYYWNEDLKVLHEIGALDLPPALKEKNTKLMSYCSMRVHVYELMYKAVAEETDKYKQQIADSTLAINTLIMEIKTIQ